MSNTIAILQQLEADAPVFSTGLYITFVLDDSWSMAPFEQQVIRAYDRLLADQQRQVGSKVFFTKATFHETLSVAPMTSLWSAVPLATGGYKANGSGTAICDALGGVIQETEKRLASNATQVVVALITDGGENASKIFTLEQVRELVLAKQAQGWKFLFVGSNQNAEREAAKYGIPTENALTFAQRHIGISRAFRALSNNLSAYRRAGSLGFTETQRQEQRLLLNERNL